MTSLKKRLLGTIATGAMLAVSVQPTVASAQDSEAAAVAAANQASAREAQERSDAIAAEVAERERQEAEANLTPKERAKLQKAREKAEKKRLKEEEKARKKAEKEANKKAKGDRTGNGITGCVLGGIGGAILGGLIGGKKGALIGAGLGCGAGAAVALGLTKKEEEELNAYVEDDFMLREDVQQASYEATESQKTVQITNAGTEVEQAEHTFVLDEYVDVRPDDLMVNERLMRVTANSLRMRGTPTTDEDNVVGGYGQDDIVRAYATTADGEWTMLVNKSAAGEVEVLGYVASQYLSTNLQAPPRARIVEAPPAQRKVTDKTKRQRTASSTGGSAKTKRTYSASTSCKVANMSVETKSVKAKSCGSASSGGYRSATLTITKGEVA